MSHKPQDLEPYSRRETNIENRINHMAGIRILDVRRVNTNNDYQHNYYYGGTAAIETLASNEIESVWTIEVDQRRIEEISDMEQSAKDMHSLFTVATTRADRMRNELNILTQRIQLLETALDENPGVRDQWDEIMVMLKMAGYIDGLVK